MTSETHGRFKRWFWRPPRAHGEIIADRQVSVLELFYDLVYVAVIGQAADHLATHVSVRGLASFAVVFALIWIAWINGSLYLELHGREDGRTRSIVFVQMGILVLLAVFTAEAADGDGWGFAVVYATYQVVQTWLWYTVWRQDRRNHPEYQAATAGYVIGSGLSVAVILASASLPTTPRLVVWAGLALIWIVGIELAAREHFAGYRSHNLLLAAVAGTTTFASSNVMTATAPGSTMSSVRRATVTGSMETPASCAMTSCDPPTNRTM